jgi:tetratricopeptide (TPR) repeat protein
MLNASTDSTTFITGEDALARGHKQFAQLNRGIVAHRLGRLGEARRIFEGVVIDHPEDIDALQLLSVVYLTNGDYEDAHDVLRRLISLGEESALIYHNLGNVLGELQRPEEAVVFYEQAARLDPNDFDLLKNYGVTLAELGRLEDALTCYDAALSNKPDPEVMNYRGVMLTRLNRYDDAVACYEQALLLNPENFEANYNLSGVFKHLNQLDEALACTEQAIKLKPDSPIALNRLGEILIEKNQNQEAVTFYKVLREEFPKNLAIINNYGLALQNLDCFDESIRQYRSALAVDSNYFNATLNLAVALGMSNRLEGALDYFADASLIQPNNPDISYNRASILQLYGHFDAALESYDQALALDPDSVDVNWNKSLLLLLQGNYEEGWPLYEWRLKREETRQEYPQFAQPLWRGETDLRGQRLLVHVEQGLGDMVQFCRYIPILADKGIEVILQVQASLLPLIASLESDVTLVSQDDPLPDFDAYCPLMSLPYALGTTLETIPSSDSYLSPCPEKLAEWREKLGSADALRVGLVWSGRKEHKNDHNRSMALADLLPVLDVPVEWHSIQQDYRAADLDVLKTLPELHQHQSDLNDFSDTAALLANLDLVITVDTSVAHVAAALGKPTWLLLPYLSDFRWLMDRVDTPWYPSMRLYRQDQPGDWTPVLQRIKNDLEQRIKSELGGRINA